MTATLCFEPDSLPTLVPSSSSPAVCYVSPTSPVPVASPTSSCIDTIFSIITVTQELPLPATTLLTTTPTTPRQSLATTSLKRYPHSPAITSLSTVEPLQTSTDKSLTITESTPAKSSAAAPSSAPVSGEECTWIGHCEGMILPFSIFSCPLTISIYFIRGLLTRKNIFQTHPGATCKTYDDCSDEYDCIDGSCAPLSQKFCDWEGHCQGMLVFTFAKTKFIYIVFLFRPSFSLFAPISNC